MSKLKVYHNSAIGSVIKTMNLRDLTEFMVGTLKEYPSKKAVIAHLLLLLSEAERKELFK